MALQPGDILEERYEILRIVKSGGMGSVYEARDQRLGGSSCAVKETLERMAAGTDGDLIRRKFRDESPILVQLRHPAIPRVRDFFEIGISYYIVNWSYQIASIAYYDDGPENIRVPLRKRAFKMTNLQRLLDKHGRAEKLDRPGDGPARELGTNRTRPPAV